jgi:endonuclease/exonuclease/phosphatase family metal-dependent hydrolase
MCSFAKLCVLLVGALSVGCEQEPPSPTTVATATPFSLATYNLYIGVDVNRIFRTTTGASGITAAAVKDGFDLVIASDPAARMDAIAAELAAVEPDVIGLIEAALWRTQTPPDGRVTPAKDVRYDFVQLIIDGLASRGLTYLPVAEAMNSDVEFNAGALDVRLTDRDVLLARADGRVTIAASTEAKFTAQLTVPTTAIGDVTLLRGWVGATATVGGGGALTIVETHLEGAADPIRDAQAVELLLTPGQEKPLVVMGDFNFGPEASIYQTYSIDGLVDQWRRLLPGEPGLTCCEEEDLRNLSAQLGSRFDLMFTRGPVQATSALVLGATPDMRTGAGLWPSDHAGLFMNYVLLP